MPADAVPEGVAFLTPFLLLLPMSARDLLSAGLLQGLWLYLRRYQVLLSKVALIPRPGSLSLHSWLAGASSALARMRSSASPNAGPWTLAGPGVGSRRLPRKHMSRATLGPACVAPWRSQVLK